jgi:hypothetical protein
MPLVLCFLPATQWQRWTKPLRGRFNSQNLLSSVNISSFIVFIARQSALHVCRLIISYNLWEAMKAMEQAFLPMIEANRKGNLKWCRIYLL